LQQVPSEICNFGQNIGSMPSSHCSWIKQHKLWQSSLHNTSLAIATSVLLRRLSPNFRLIAEKVDSTFDRWW
jgi:hypothetical protein